MGDISKYFSRSEFACKCGCGFAAVDVSVHEALRYLRITFKKPVFINSGCRCVEYNKKVGGVENSYHTKGMAVDIRIDGVKQIEVAIALSCMYPDRYGIIQYKNFVHFDVRDTKYRKEMD